MYAFDVFKLKVDWNNAANSVLSGPTLVSQTTFGLPFIGNSSNIVPQPDTSTLLDSLGFRLMMQLQYRNIAGVESLWTTHTVRPTGQSTGPTGIQWAQLNVTGGTIAASPVQQQIFTNGGDGLYGWVPSIAVDRMGNAAVGYSTSSSTSYPSIEYAGRLSGDAPGTLGQGKAVLQAGSASQNFNCGGNNPCSRWGDYTAMTVDPADDCTFWYVGEYYASAGASWSTRIGSFKYPSCPPPPVAITNLTVAADASNVKLELRPIPPSTTARMSGPVTRIPTLHLLPAPTAALIPSPPRPGATSGSSATRRPAPFITSCSARSPASRRLHRGELASSSSHWRPAP